MAERRRARFAVIVARFLSPMPLWLLDLIGARSDITLEEIRTLLRQRGISVSVTTVWSFYDRHGISFKKTISDSVRLWA